MISLTSEHITPWHRLGAGAKFLFLSLVTLGLFLTDDLIVLLAALLLVGLFYLVGGMGFAREGLRNLKPLIYFFGLIMVWHLWVGTAEVGLKLLLRVCAAVGLANLVTMTSKLRDMLALLHRLLGPLRALGVSTRPGEIAAAMVIRFVPVLSDKTRVLSESWRARSARRAGWRIVLPVAVCALDDAEQVAEALRARGGVSGGARHGAHPDEQQKPNTVHKTQNHT